MTVEIETFDAQDDWLARRREVVTASDMPLIMGNEGAVKWMEKDHPDMHYLEGLWRYKRGEFGETPDSIVMRMGRELEPLIGELYVESLKAVELHGNNGNFAMHVRAGWAASTLDFEAWGFNKYGEHVPLHIVEAKTGMYKAENVTPRYKYQCHWQMFVTGFDRCDIAYLNKVKATFEVFQIDRDEKIEKEMVKRAKMFYDAMQSDKAPNCAALAAGF